MYMYGVKLKMMKKFFFAVIKYYCHVCAPLFAEIVLKMQLLNYRIQT